MTTSFKEYLFLTEARKSSVKYTEKNVKGALDRVTATLSGTSSASMTKLAKRYARLEVSMKAMKAKHEELNARLKEDVSDLFDAEDVVVTRVVETAQFTLTLAKEIQKTEGTKEVNYEAIVAELTKLIPQELQATVDMITEKYTKVIPPKAPVKRLTVSKEITEGILDNVKRLHSWIKGLITQVTRWASRFDSKLEALKTKAGLN